MSDTRTVPGPVEWCCIDCLSLLAYGEDPVGTMSEDEITEWHARIDDTLSGGTEVTLGMLASEHSDYCPVKIHDSHDAVDECGCDTVSFSWSACDLCRSNPGGERHAITFWTVPTEVSS